MSLIVAVKHICGRNNDAKWKTPPVVQIIKDKNRLPAVSLRDKDQHLVARDTFHVELIDIQTALFAC